MRRKALVVVMSVALAGCTANGPFRTGSTFPLLDYRLPQTAVKATLSLTLVRCSGRLEVEGQFALHGEGGASRQTFVLTPGALESARIKRSLEVKLHDTGAIASVNAVNSDRTGAIVGNVVRFAASVAGALFGLQLPAAAPGRGRATICNGVTEDALVRLAAINKTISTARKSLPTTPSAYRANSQMLDRLLAERHALLAGPLQVGLATTLDLIKAAPAAGNASYSGESIIDLAPVAEMWLQEGIRSVPTGSISWTATPVGINGAAFATASPAALCQAELANANGSGLCFAEPVVAAFSATAKFDGLGQEGRPLTLTAAKPFPVPQWGNLRFLPLAVAVGSSRETALTFDKFGRVSEMKWASEARAETLTSAAADLAEQAQGIVAANSETSRQKSEIEALETQQKLNRLRACREILSKGGSACPAEATVDDSEQEGQ